MPTKSRKRKPSKRKPKAPMNLTCSRCGFKTRSGIAAMMKHYRSKHAKALKRR